jgi:hypothetical protein
MEPDRAAGIFRRRCRVKGEAPVRSVRRYLALILVGFVAIVAAVGLLNAQAEKGNYAPATLGELQQPPRATINDDSVYGVTAYPQYAPELADGEGRGETVGFCSGCHSNRYITMQPPLPAATWEAEVTKMRKTFGAPIPDAPAAVITKYLQAHYTPETRKQ